MFNFILIFKKIPILSFTVSIFTIVISVLYFLTDEYIPANPYFTLFILMIAVISLLMNGISLQEGNKR